MDAHFVANPGPYEQYYERRHKRISASGPIPTENSDKDVIAYIRDKYIRDPGLLIEEDFNEGVNSGHGSPDRYQELQKKSIGKYSPVIIESIDNVVDSIDALVRDEPPLSDRDDNFSIREVMIGSARNRDSTNAAKEQNVGHILTNSKFQVFSNSRTLEEINSNHNKCARMPRNAIRFEVGGKENLKSQSTQFNIHDTHEKITSSTASLNKDRSQPDNNCIKKSKRKTYSLLLGSNSLKEQNLGTLKVNSDENKNSTSNLGSRMVTETNIPPLEPQMFARKQRSLADSFLQGLNKLQRTTEASPGLQRHQPPQQPVTPELIQELMKKQDKMLEMLTHQNLVRGSRRSYTYHHTLSSEFAPEDRKSTQAALEIEVRSLRDDVKILREIIEGVLNQRAEDRSTIKMLEDKVKTFQIQCATATTCRDSKKREIDSTFTKQFTNLLPNNQHSLSGSILANSKLSGLISPPRERNLCSKM